MSKFITLTALFFLITVSLSFGQKKQIEEYIVFNQGDTLSGEVKLKSDSLLLFTNLDLIKGTYTADNLKAFHADDKYYTVVKIKGQNRFVQEVVLGYLSLYMAVGQGFYLERNDTLFFVDEITSPGVMGYFLRDCVESTELTAGKIRNQYKYSLGGLIKFVSFYNTCKGYQEDQAVKYTPKKLNIKPVVKVGLDTHQFEFGDKNKNNSGAKFGNNVGFVVGVSTAFGKGQGLSVHPGIFFTHRTGEANLEVPINKYTSEDMELSVNFLEAPILLRYTFNGSSFIPFVSAGPHVGMSFGSKINRTPYRFSYTEYFDKRANQMGIKYGLSGGAGVFLPHVMKGLEVEFRAEKSYYENEYDLIDLQNTSVQLLVGFYLR